jgi:GGDEF domain-containing protein
MLNRISFLFFPPLLLLLALAMAPLAVQLPTEYLPLLELLPYISAAIGLALAWRFNRSRAFFSLLVLFIAYLLIQPFWSGDEEQTRWLSLAASALLPLNLLMLSVIKERGIFTIHGWVRFSILVVQAVALLWLLYMGEAGWQTVAYQQWLPVSGSEDLTVPQISQLLALLSAIVLIARIFITPSLMETVLFACLLFGFGSQAIPMEATTQALMFSICIILLIFVLVQDSYGMAYMDELTGLPGRRAINQTMAGLGNRYAIAMLDVDHFKKFNDTHGHDVGDQVLRMVADRINEVGGGGRAARYGGEEFCVIFPGKRVTDVYAHLDVVREKIAETPFVIRDKKRPKDPPKQAKKAKSEGKKVHVSVSIGVAERSEIYPRPEMVMKAADNALYKAKDSGRNKVCKSVVE